MPDYQFIHHYGCEPYAANNGAGGATITQQNLVITAWGGTQADETKPDVFEDAQLLIPNPNNSDAAITSLERVATAQGFHSRHSAHTFVQQNKGKQTPSIMPVGYVLNPPPEFKQAMCGALTFNGGDPADKANWTAKKSIMSQYAWRYSAEFVLRDTRNLIANNAIDNSNAFISTQAAYSTYLHLPDLDDDSYRLPFLKTSGADGVAPQFFDPYTAGGAQEMVAAVNRGEFFVFMEIRADIPEKITGPLLTVNHTIVWPHSAARG
jgi:hypothetical protein